jgi:Arc/MetJ family transcription regulator
VGLGPRPGIRKVVCLAVRASVVYSLVYQEVYVSMPRMMVELDDDLLAEAKRLTGARTKRAAIETALAELVRRRKAAELATFAGRVPIRLTRRRLRTMREGR